MLCIATYAFALMTFTSAGLLRASEKPNILFLFADDHAYDSVGLMTDGYVQTPAIDQLAAQGVYFERAYNMGAWNGAVCIASRTMLNTGKSLWRAQSLKPRQSLPIQPSWSQRLKQAGYTTYFTGKWHVKLYDPKTLFDQCGTIRPGMPNTKDDHHRPVQGQPDTWSPSDPIHEGFWRGGKHWSEVTADETISFLKEYHKADTSKPFFAYIAFNAPHDPRQSPQEYLDRYPLESVPLPGSYMTSYPHTEALGIWGIRAETLAPRPRTEYATKTHRREYYALISHMDDQISRILAELDRLGLRENTIIIYTADHGLSLGNHSFFAKQSMYDHSLASPLIISGPGIPQNVRTQQRIYIQDVVPTTLELAGIPESDFSDMEFTSLLPLNTSGTGRSLPSVLGGYKDLSRCIIQGPWKLMYYAKLKRFRLYHLEKDPHELNDVAEHPENRQVIQNLLQSLKAQQQEFGDKLKISAPE
ncbi:MAG: sulfatase-like hydrolase/transferase [Verrucomicrobiota bacterium]